MAFWSIGHILNKIFDSTLSALGVKAAGDVAHDAADSGNPIKVGFKAESTTPAAVADGDRSDLGGTLYGAAFVNPVTSAGAQMTGATGAAVPAGAMQAGGSDGTNLQPLRMVAQGSNPADAAYVLGVVDIMAGSGNAWGRKSTAGALADGNSGTNMPPEAPFLWNGATFDKERSNTAQSPLASAQRTATTNSSDLTLYNESGADFIINISSINAGTPSITVNIQVKDNISSNYVTVLSSAALTSVATTRLRVYPGITAAANLAVSDILRRTIRVSVTHADAQAIDYSISMGTLTA